MNTDSSDTMIHFYILRDELKVGAVVKQYKSNGSAYDRYPKAIML